MMDQQPTDIRGSKPLVEVLGNASAASALHLALELELLERLAERGEFSLDQLQDALSTGLGAECSHRGARAILLSLAVPRIIEFDGNRGTHHLASWLRPAELAEARRLLAAEIFEDLAGFQKYTRQEHALPVAMPPVADPRAELRLCALGWSDPVIPLQALTELDVRLRSPLLAKFSWDALLTALQAGLFQTLAGSEPLKIPELAEQCRWHSTATELILENLTFHGLVEHAGGECADAYRLSATGRQYLIPAAAETPSPYYIGDYFALALHPTGYVSRMAVRAGLLRTSSQMLQHLATDALAPFIRAMQAHTVRSAAAVARAPEMQDILLRSGVIVDVGGGSGAMLQELLKRHSHLTGILYDIEDVCAFTRQRFVAEMPDLAGRIKFHGGDMFVDHHFPAALEARPGITPAFVLGSILHDWTEPRCIEILEKAFRSLPQGGHVLIHELFLEEDPNENPAFAVAMNLAMLQWTEGRQFTVIELRSWVEAALARVGRPRGGYRFRVVEGDDFYSVAVISLPPHQTP